MSNAFLQVVALGSWLGSAGLFIYTFDPIYFAVFAYMTVTKWEQ